MGAHLPQSPVPSFDSKSEGGHGLINPALKNLPPISPFVRKIPALPYAALVPHRRHATIPA